MQVERSPHPNGCWIWTGRGSHQGYGRVHVDGRDMKAHRVSYLLGCGEIPSGLVICHKCDVRLCVNPDHLFLGTHGDNVADTVAKNRQPCGESHGLSKLTSKQVEEIRRIYLAGGISQLKLAEDYSVSRSRISFIVTGKHWKDSNYEGRHFTERKSHAAPRGEHHWNAKLSRADVEHIRFTFATGSVTKTALARKFGVCIQTICNVVSGSHYPKANE